MPTISFKNPAVLLKAFKENITSRTGLNVFTRDSKVRAISASLEEELISLREETIASENRKDFATASGPDLVQIGLRKQLPKLVAGHAVVSPGERNTAFYVESGTFGDLNSGANIVIPAGQTIFSTKNTNELGTTVDYVVTTTTTLLAADSITYFPCRAVNIGSASNVGKGVLRSHGFTNYTLSSLNGLKVINFYPILSGVDDETDNNYRARLANYYVRIATNNDTKLKLLGIEVPGAVNTVVRPGYYGIGTAAVFSLGPENQTNDRLVAQLQDKLNLVKPPGGDFYAVPAVEVKFDLEMEFKTVSTLSTTEAQRIKTDVNRLVLEYFKSLTLGSTVDLAILANYLQRNVSNFVAFNRVNLNNVFKRVYVRKGINGAYDEKYRLTGNLYLLKEDEYASAGVLTVSVT